MLKPFTCQAVAHHLAAYLANELSAEQRAAFNAHLSTCAECEQYVFAARRLDLDLRAEFAAWQPRLPRLASAHIQEQVYARMRAQLHWQKVGQWAGNAVSVLVVAVLVAAAWAVWQLSVEPLKRVPPAPPAALWGMEQGNAQGALWAQTLGPRQPQLQWEAFEPSRFTGGPVVSAAGTLYIASQDARLHALSPEGAKLWSAVLPQAAIGTPALSAENVLYLTDVQGGLMAVSNNGRVLWHFNSPKDGGLSSPVLGPDNTLYYASMLHLQAISPEGQLRWRVPLPTYSYVSPLPRLSTDGRYLAFADTVVEAATGQILNPATPEQFDAFVVGADGQLYLQQSASFTRWGPGQPSHTDQTTEASAESQRPFPSMAGVLPDGRGWVYLFNENGRNLLWLEPGQAASLTPSGPAFEILGVMHAGRVVAVDEAGVVFACKEFFARPLSPATCYAHTFGAQTPLWQFPIKWRGEAVIGGALAQETLYLVTSGGYLLAVSDGPH